MVHVRVCVPPPHVTEHVDQPEKPPLTTVPPEPEQPFDTAKPIWVLVRSNNVTKLFMNDQPMIVSEEGAIPGQKSVRPVLSMVCMMYELIPGSDTVNDPPPVLAKVKVSEGNC